MKKQTLKLYIRALIIGLALNLLIQQISNVAVAQNTTEPEPVQFHLNLDF